MHKCLCCGNLSPTIVSVGDRAQAVCTAECGTRGPIRDTIEQAAAGWDHLMGSMVMVVDQSIEQWKALALDGHFIPAIKAHREIYRSSLADAHRAVMEAGGTRTKKKATAPVEGL